MLARSLVFKIFLFLFLCSNGLKVFLWFLLLLLRRGMCRMKQTRRSSAEEEEEEEDDAVPGSAAGTG